MGVIHRGVQLMTRGGWADKILQGKDIMECPHLRSRIQRQGMRSKSQRNSKVMSRKAKRGILGLCLKKMVRSIKYN